MTWFSSVSGSAGGAPGCSRGRADGCRVRAAGGGAVGGVCRHLCADDVPAGGDDRRHCGTVAVRPGRAGTGGGGGNRDAAGVPGHAPGRHRKQLCGGCVRTASGGKRVPGPGGVRRGHGGNLVVGDPEQRPGRGTVLHLGGGRQRRRSGAAVGRPGLVRSGVRRSAGGAVCPWSRCARHLR